MATQRSSKSLLRVRVPRDAPMSLSSNWIRKLAFQAGRYRFESDKRYQYLCSTMDGAERYERFGWGFESSHRCQSLSGVIGSHAGSRSQWSQDRAGSSPALKTNTTVPQMAEGVRSDRIQSEFESRESYQWACGIIGITSHLQCDKQSSSLCWSTNGLMAAGTPNRSLKPRYEGSSPS